MPAPRTRPYRPSNGTEGMIFDEEWCSRCRRDAAYRDDQQAEPCDILSRTLVHDIGDPEYPVEWVRDDVWWPKNSHPRCTAFVPVGEEGSTYVQDKRQQELDI